MVLRLILFLIFVYFGIKTVLTIGRYLKSAWPEKHLASTVRQTPTKEMVQDAVCGMYIIKEEAVSYHRREGVRYFCSEECKNKYIEKQMHN